ncbi:MAG TPA: methyltransferase domain-containing protein [Nocardioides sp.]|uniref:class I SAM-dependent methyltransferase n=1 Tax=Nocardioides sp. TaxID=35761 RepID=UPI002F428A9D
MSFDVSADAYLRFMGRYSVPLAEQFVELVGVRRGDRVLDVGCGPGVLTAPLVERCGADSVAAVDPSSSFISAVGERFPAVDVREAPAESLPYDDDAFDAALAQLVVHFMNDPVAGLREMGRVARPGGVVAASVWDFAGGTAPLSVFWQAARELDPSAPGEADRAGAREGDLVDLANAAGLRAARSTSLTVRLPFTSYDAWWAPYLDGVGPVGSYVASLEPEHRRRVEERCRELLPAPPFEHAARAWVVLAEAA